MFMSERGMSDFMPQRYQREVMDKIISGGKMIGIYRRARPYGLTVAQLDTFNKICKDGKKRIQWHAPDWVAMDRESFEALQRAANVHPWPGYPLPIIGDENVLPPYHPRERFKNE